MNDERPTVNDSPATLHGFPVKILDGATLAGMKLGTPGSPVTFGPPLESVTSLVATTASPDLAVPVVDLRRLSASVMWPEFARVAAVHPAFRYRLQ